MPKQPDEITTTEAAAILGVTAQTMRNYTERGYLRYRRLPSGARRFDRAEVEALRASGMSPEVAVQ